MTAGVPARLGRYEILRPLARGGMAELFLARATGLSGFEKLVVVKRILPELQRDADNVAMFLDEARLAAGLHHSNIVQVYDVGEADGVPFFAMEYLDGEDVRAICRAAHRRGERIPVEHVLSIVIGVAAGLHYAHERRDGDGRPLGIVHRDVSPTNVAVTFDGGVKLLDFGVAKARRRSVETRHGTLKGKLGYMSPEQCRGDELDRRSDVFALAIMLWELVTGRRLYGGRSDFGIMKSIAETDAPRPSLVWPECPPALEQICLRGLMREPAARFQTAEELQLALEAFARERKLAVSGVGLGHWLRGLGGARPLPVGGEASTLYDAAAPDDDAAAATIVDGVVDTASLTPGSGPPLRRTRAVARRPRRRPRALVLVVAGALAIAAATSVGLVRLLRAPVHARSAPPPTTTATAPRTLEPPPPLEVTPEPAVAPSAAAPPPRAAHAVTHAATRASKRPHPARAAHPSPRAPAGVDLDAPLPPR